MQEMPPLPAGIRLLTDVEADYLRSEIPDVPHSPEQCVTCKGKGTFKWWEPPGRKEVVEWKCDCMGQYRLYLYLLYSGIGKAYQRLSWSDATHVHPGSIEAIADYIQHADARVDSGVSLILHGQQTGTGKTLMTTLLAKALLAQGRDLHFTTFSTMIDTYTGGWTDPEKQRWYHRRVKNAGVLVLDDVGREYVGRTNTGFEEVIRHRVANAKPTIITTNETLTRLFERYGGNVFSLLQERSHTHEFKGSDFREEQRKRLDQEIELGLTAPLVIG